MASQDLERRDRTPLDAVVAQVASDQFVAKIANALPEDITPQRFVSVTVTAIKRSPELITAEADSLYTSIIRCAQDGLMPDGREAALVIFKENGVPKVQYLPMIGGIRKVAAEDGFTLNAHVVYENDDFDYELGARAWVKHKPAPLGQQRGEPRGAYATATDASGQLVADPEVMDVAQIEHVRSKSKQKDGLAWKNDWPEMARKTVARRLFKSLPRGRQTSERVDRVIRAADEEFEFPPDAPPMTAAQANAAAAAGAGQPTAGAQQLRDEPEARTDLPSDAQLNRIAQLEQQVDDEPACAATLTGLFGARTAADLSTGDAERYEGWLTRYLEQRDEPPVVEGQAREAPEEEGEQRSFADLVPDAVKQKAGGS